MGESFDEHTPHGDLDKRLQIEYCHRYHLWKPPRMKRIWYKRISRDYRNRGYSDPQEQWRKRLNDFDEILKLSYVPMWWWLLLVLVYLGIVVSLFGLMLALEDRLALMLILLAVFSVVELILLWMIIRVQRRRTRRASIQLAKKVREMNHDLAKDEEKKKREEEEEKKKGEEEEEKKKGEEEEEKKKGEEEEKKSRSDGKSVAARNESTFLRFELPLPSIPGVLLHAVFFSQKKDAESDDGKTKTD